MKDIEEIFREVETVPDFAGHKITGVSYTNGYGDTPLHIVANYGDSEAIEVMVSAGADINAIGESGYTPLHCAAEQNKPEAVSRLIQLGAEILEDESGLTPLELARVVKSQEAVNVLEKNT